MRGCQRKIIVLRGTDSEIFDEAYFLLRKDFDRKRQDEDALLREAQRLVESNTTRQRTKSRPRWLLFTAGMLAGGALFLLVAVIL